MDAPLAGTVGAAALGGVISGLALQINQQRLERKRRQEAYQTLRSSLVSDLLHNVKAIHKIWTDAKQPYHTMSTNDSTLAMFLRGKTIGVVGTGAPQSLHLETWDLARNHLMSMTDKPSDGIRFARSFQVLKDCLATNDQGPYSASAIFYRDPNTLVQPTVLTAAGHQIYAVPGAVFRVTHDDRVKNAILELIIEYGNLEEVKEAGELAEGEWRGGEGWKSVEGLSAWIPSKFFPEESSP